MKLSRYLAMALSLPCLIGLPVALAADVVPAPNGIKLPENYRDWRVIASSSRIDNHTLRVILGNDIAIEAARAGTTNPWPNGAILGKMVWKDATLPAWEKAVVPGEFVQGILDDGTVVWHFQDDAVSGDVFIDDSDPVAPFVDQPFWIEEYYKFFWQLCPAGAGVDGPPEIEEFSKDLAFELWTNNDCFPSTHPDYATWISVGRPACWCYVRQCHGDTDNIQEPAGKGHQ